MQVDKKIENDIATIIHKYSKKYIPRKSGKLADNVTIEGNKIKYNSDYAKEQYFNNNAGKYWDKRAISDNRREIISEIAKLIKWVNK